MSWSLEDAKNKFEEMVAQAMAGEPQRVALDGGDAVVVVAADEFDRLQLTDHAETDSFVEFLTQIPAGTPVEPREVQPRDTD